LETVKIVQNLGIFPRINHERKRAEISRDGRSHKAATGHGFSPPTTGVFEMVLYPWHKNEILKNFFLNFTLKIMKI